MLSSSVALRLPLFNVSYMLSSLSVALPFPLSKGSLLSPVAKTNPSSKVFSIFSWFLI